MKLFTHKYSVSIYENGRFCWKNHGWIRVDDIGSQGFFVRLSDVLFYVAIAAIIYVKYFQ